MLSKRIDASFFIILSNGIVRTGSHDIPSPQRIRDNGVQAVDVLAMVEDEEQAEAKHGHDVGRQRQKEEEEVTVVPSTDAVVHPRAVVVKVLQYEG